MIALLEAVREHWAAMFGWLGAALIIDALDGPIARRLDVARVQPNWSGDVLDLVVDFVTYVFVPAYAITASGLLLPVAAPLLGAGIVVTGALYFADRRMKAADNHFRGFPALWNAAAFYLFLLHLPPALSSLAVAVLIALTFAPIHVVHPIRVVRLRGLTLSLLGHNGNLTNTEALADALGMLPGIMSSDSDLLAELLARHVVDRAPTSARRWPPCCRRSRAPSRWCCSTTAASTASATRTASARCASVASTAVGCWRSETPALDIVGARFVRELEPGEVVVIDADGPRSSTRSRRRAAIPGCACSSSCTSPGPTPSCTARNVDAARVRMGEQLAVQAPLPPDRSDGPAPTGPGDARARERRAGGAGLRPGQRHARTATAW